MENNQGTKRRHEEKRLQKVSATEETLAKLEDGVFEIYQFAGGMSEAWENFVKIRKCETKEHVEYVQCIECKGLLSFKEDSGTSHLLRHKCPKIKNDESDGIKFRSLPLDKKAPTRKLITNNIIKYCTRDMISCEAVCDSKNFLSMVQSFVLHGHKNGYTDLEHVFPSSEQVNRGIGNIIAEKTQEICKTFQDSIKQQWCSATVEIQTYESSTHNSIKTILMSIQYFEKELKELKKQFCLSFILRDNDTPDCFLNKLIRRFNTIGGDRHDLLALKIVTPDDEIFSNALASFNRINCVADAITKILNEAFKPTFLTEGSDTLSNCIGIVKHIKSTGKYNVELEEDNGTWKSKINMLRTIVENSEEILKILEDGGDENLQFNKRKTEEVISFLDVFVEAIDDLSASSYTTANKILLWHAVLTDHLNSHENCSIELKRIKTNAKEIFDTRFRPTLDNKIDCFLDPRYKSMKMLADSEKNHVIAEVRKLLDMLDIDDELATYTSATKKNRTKNFEGGADLQIKDNSKKTSRFSKFETLNEDFKEMDEVDIYIKLPAMTSSNFPTEFDVIKKFWKQQKNKLPKLFKLVSIRLHVPACCGNAGVKAFQLIQNLNPNTLADYLFVKNNF